MADDGEGIRECRLRLEHLMRVHEMAVARTARERQDARPRVPIRTEAGADQQGLSVPPELADEQQRTTG